MRAALNLAHDAIETRSRGYMCFTGVHGIMEAQRDVRLREALNNAMMNLPDGMPTVWTGRIRGHKQMGRVFGPDFMLNFCAESVQRGYTHFLYGGAPGVAAALRENLLARFPGLRIVGTFTPPFRELNESEERELVELLATLRPDCLWVGLSTPKQERFMSRYVDRTQATLMLGVGAAFDYHTGRIKDAPEWVKNSGLQWVHRLIQEPKRLWKRYLVNNPMFVLNLVSQLAGLRMYPPPHRRAESRTQSEWSSQ
ncbi:MAG TPA: WecB/TagA/CpsF family glycosyltransferase [Terriglobales bacterium]|nr:WecB/TagA/CpsF family glycosyltransferase [Terriglobales bacterium]